MLHPPPLLQGGSDTCSAFTPPWECLRFLQLQHLQLEMRNNGEGMWERGGGEGSSVEESRAQADKGRETD